MMQSLFDVVVPEWNEVERSVSVEDATWCVEALRLINKFSSAGWLQLFSLLVEQRRIQAALAVALKSAPAHVKSHVLAFPAMVGFPPQIVTALAHSLTAGDFSAEAEQPKVLPLSESSPLFGIAEHNRLHHILSRLEAEPKDGLVSDLMTVFEYRLAEDAREQKILNASLAEANNRVANLMQRVDTFKEENLLVRRCLANALQSLEQTKVERDGALASAESARAAAKKDFKQNQEMKAQYEIKLKELEKKCQQLQKSVEEKTAINTTLTNVSCFMGRKGTSHQYRSIQKLVIFVFLLDFRSY